MSGAPSLTIAPLRLTTTRGQSRVTQSKAHQDVTDVSGLVTGRRRRKKCDMNAGVGTVECSRRTHS